MGYANLFKFLQLIHPQANLRTVCVMRGFVDVHWAYNGVRITLLKSIKVEIFCIKNFHSRCEKHYLLEDIFHIIDFSKGLETMKSSKGISGGSNGISI